MSALTRRLYVISWLILGAVALGYFYVLFDSVRDPQKDRIASALFPQTVRSEPSAAAGDPSLSQALERMRGEIDRLKDALTALDKENAALKAHIGTLEQTYGPATAALPLRAETREPDPLAPGEGSMPEVGAAEPDDAREREEKAVTASVREEPEEKNTPASAEKPGAEVKEPIAEESGEEKIVKAAARGDMAPEAEKNPGPARKERPDSRAEPGISVTMMPMPADGFDQALPKSPLPIAGETEPRRTMFAVELATGLTADEVEPRWKEIRKRHGKLLDELQPRSISASPGSQDVNLAHRLVAGPFRNAAAAARLCARLSAAGVRCRQTVFGGAPVGGDGDVAIR